MKVSGVMVVLAVLTSTRAAWADDIRWKVREEMTVGTYYGYMVAFVSDNFQKKDADAFVKLVLVPDWKLFRKEDGFHENFLI